MRRYVRTLALLGVAAMLVSTLVAWLDMSAWWLVGAVASGYGAALIAAPTGWAIGWLVRDAEQGCEVGTWSAWPVDEDGVPSSAPVQGRLVVDPPERVT